MRSFCPCYGGPCLFLKAVQMITRATFCDPDRFASMMIGRWKNICPLFSRFAREADRFSKQLSAQSQEARNFSASHMSSDSIAINSSRIYATKEYLVSIC